MHTGGENQSRDPPRLAARFWDEFSGKQTLLDKFFLGKKAALGPSVPLSAPSQASSSLTPVAVSTSAAASTHSSHFADQLAKSPPPSLAPPTERLESTLPSDSSSISPTFTAAECPSPITVPPAYTPLTSATITLTHPPSSESTIRSQGKRPSTDDGLSGSKKQKLQKKGDSKIKETGKSTGKGKQTGQMQLSSFFAKPKPATPSSKTPLSTPQSSRLSKSASPSDLHSNEPPDLDADYRLALALSQESSTSQSNSSSSRVESEKKKQAWTSLLAPLPPPKCVVHREPAKEFTVNKPGPNKGKAFFICSRYVYAILHLLQPFDRNDYLLSRPVGPGYDKGKAERLREHVDSTWRCDFFKWKTDVWAERRREER